ncbi:interleukin-22 receptor subunit alpha-2 [Cyprinodon tularosa]|uniref:interleukin-22 receptor subunit alpha-2 n=1 Tax=Cyprinodon tularosa TaxID=77115 RepID=UPI0018E26715|nr:interleukin-22 receptor subunit alpha-2 [Cyprinodon tularosa]XP_038152074.1 interleukin-22 receptor subunit alpha-2 [Cyprinodon tularosa]
MTRLLLRTMLLGNLAFCVTAQEMLTPPGQVKFTSINYRNVLHWVAPTNSTSLHYNVQYKIYGEMDWLKVSSCQGIRRHKCDLSNVTSDTTEWYYAQVQATSVASSSKSAWALSPRFSPRWDTKISPPDVKINSSKQGIVIQVKAARLLVHKMHSSVEYKVYVLHNGKEDMYDITCCSHKLTLTKLNPKTQYCVQAETVIFRHMKSSDRSSAKCITTP